MASPARIEGSNEFPQHLTWTTRDRIPVFADVAVGLRCLEIMEEERKRLRVEVYGYAVMPDHLHLVTGPSIFPVGTTVQWMKLATAYHLKVDGLLEGSPWARGYWDRGLRDAVALVAALEYVHFNPVKEGLTEVAAEYQLSSAGYYELGAKSPLRVSTPII